MLYRAYKNKLKALISKSEIYYYQNIFSDRKNNIKDMWKHLGFVLNPNKHNSHNKKSVSKLNINGKTITEDKNITNAFSKYFADVGSNLANKIVKNQPQKSYKGYLSNPEAETIFLSPTNTEEISKEISFLNDKKNGMDPFKTSIIISIKNEIAEVFAIISRIIFNKSLEERNLPNLLKIAKVLPIYKGGDNDNPVNYRPLSFLSILIKSLKK